MPNHLNPHLSFVWHDCLIIGFTLPHHAHKSIFQFGLNLGDLTQPDQSQVIWVGTNLHSAWALFSSVLESDLGLDLVALKKGNQVEQYGILFNHVASKLCCLFMPRCVQLFMIGEESFFFFFGK